MPELIQRLKKKTIKYIISDRELLHGKSLTHRNKINSDQT